MSEFCNLLKSYRVTKVVGDRYGGLWPVEQFSKFGLTYEQSAKPKSDLYVDALPLINSGRIELLDHPKSISQLCALERRCVRGGRDTVDHPPGGHDDLSNVIAGCAATFTSGREGYYNINSLCSDWQDPDGEPDPDGARAWRWMQLMQHIGRHIG